MPLATLQLGRGTLILTARDEKYCWLFLKLDPPFMTESRFGLIEFFFSVKRVVGERELTA